MPRQRGKVVERRGRAGEDDGPQSDAERRIEARALNAGVESRLFLRRRDSRDEQRSGDRKVERVKRGCSGGREKKRNSE